MIARLAVVAAALLMTLTACGVNEKNWPTRSGKAFCKFQKRCAKTEFFYHYENVDECVASFEKFFEDYDSFYNTCDFDKEQARECLDAYDHSCKTVGAEYARYDGACEGVWQCDGPLPFEDTSATE